MEMFLQAYSVVGVVFGQIVKSVGFPARYVVLANIGLAVIVAGYTLGWDFQSIIQGVEAALAATGLFEVGKRTLGGQPTSS